jgi:hypothetical protein
MSAIAYRGHASNSDIWSAVVYSCLRFLSIVLLSSIRPFSPRRQVSSSAGSDWADLSSHITAPPRSRNIARRCVWLSSDTDTRAANSQTNPRCPGCRGSMSAAVQLVKHELAQHGAPQTRGRVATFRAAPGHS